jgi:hypothetical protein
MYVVRPADPDQFNGVLLVNWQNVTNGDDLGIPATRDLDDGFAWAGITTQAAAINGQRDPRGILPTSHGMPAWDPGRYPSLSYPATSTAGRSSPTPPGHSPPTAPPPRSTHSAASILGS